METIIIKINTIHPACTTIIDRTDGAGEWEREVQVAAARWLRSLRATAPLSAFVGDETVPGLAVLPENATDAQWLSWLKSNFTSNSHPVGTASMMARELGGVVDPRFKVYGSRNLRVVDASVFPLQVCGHTTSTLYAVVERAADFIKEDW